MHSTTTQLSTLAWQRLDRDHLLHPFGNHEVLARQGARIYTHGQGVYVWDSQGKRYLDGMSGLWCLHLGYGRHELITAATRQLETLAFQSSFFDSATLPTIELAAAVADVAPAGLQRVFFTNSGSESVDTAVRMARRYWELQGQPQRRLIIGRHNGYHGSTVTAASIGGMDAMRSMGDLAQSETIHIQQPHWWALGRPHGVDPDTFGQVAAQLLELAILDAGPERVAAFIGEPIQGSGGVIVPPATYWPEIQRICDKYGVLLISDEVVTGFGRSGAWFCSEGMGMRPDLLTFAKGVTSGYVPLGGVLVSDKVSEVLFGSGIGFAHGFTYSGHPTACAVGLATMQVMHGHKLVERAACEAGLAFAAGLVRLAGHPLVAECQSYGLMGALQLQHDTRCLQSAGARTLEVAERCSAYCAAMGLIIRITGDRLMLAPPLIISPEEIEQAIDILANALDMVAETLH